MGFLVRFGAASVAVFILSSDLVGQELVDVRPELVDARIEFLQLDDGGASEVIGSYLYNSMKRREFSEYAKGRLLRRATEVAGVCKLDEAAGKRLELAAKADVDRFLGKIRQLELDCRGVPLDNSPKSRAGIAAIQELKQQLESDQPVENSLLDKMLPKILSDEQRKMLDEFERSKRERRIEAACRVVVARIERSMPLVDGQRGQLLDAMLAVQQPNEFTSEQEMPLGHRALDKVPDAKLAELFDEAQLKVIKQYRARWAGLAATVE